MDPARSRHAGAQRVVERRLRQWEIQRRQAPARRTGAAVKVQPYVALSRTVGSGAGEIAELLSRRLGWEVSDKEVLEHMAADDNVRRRIYTLMDERKENWLDDILRPITLGPGSLRNDYFRRLRAAIAAIGAQAPAIFVGRGAGLLLPPEAGLRVRLAAPRDFRIANYARRYQMDVEQAAARVDRIDRERSQFLESYCGVHPDAAESYDLAINTASFAASDAVEIIIAALKSKIPAVAEVRPKGT